MNASGIVLTGTAEDNNYGFTGRYLDDETGLWYFRARYFSDELGRFINRDPLGYVDGMSLYAGYFAERYSVDPNGTNCPSCKSEPDTPDLGTDCEKCGGVDKPKEPGNWKCCGSVTLYNNEDGHALGNKWYDADKSCCIEKMESFNTEEIGIIWENNKTIVSKSKDIDVYVCFRPAQMLSWRWPENVAASMGAYHMWLMTKYSERGLGPVGGGVPGLDGNTDMYPQSGVTRHIGQHAASGSKCFKIKLNACKIAWQMRPRKTGKNCGISWNCNDWVWESLNNAGATKTDITRVKKEAKHYHENIANPAVSIGNAFGSGLSFGGR